jgi:integrase/recombinase XerD
MNLQLLIKQYLSYRKSLGWRACSESGYLGGFGRFMGTEADIADVRVDQVQAFLIGAGPITSTWHTKYTILRSFYRYAVSRGYVTASPLPIAIPKRPPRFVPYIYSYEELRRLVRAADTVRRRADCCLDTSTMRTVLLLLYGAGLRLQEALDLNDIDVDLMSPLLTIHQSKFTKTRLVPIGSHLRQALALYARARTGGTESPFFATRAGGRIRRELVEEYFRILCQSEGIWRNDGACHQPRLHDLRHTFAVHRLTSWYQQGADVQKLLPHLSTYLGHVDIHCTQIYLSMTPELLDEAGKRFQQYAAKDGRHE